MKRVLLILLTPAALILFSWLAMDKVLLPQLAQWTQRTLEEYSSKPGSPIHVKMQSLHLQLFGPMVSITKLELEPQDELAKTLGPLTINSIVGRLDLFEAVLGQVQLGSMLIEGLDGSLQLDPLLETHGPAERLPLDLLFLWTRRIPVHQMILEKSKFLIASEKLKASSEIQLDKALLSNAGDQLKLSASAPEVRLTLGPTVAISVILSAELTPKELNLTQLRIRRGDLQVRLDGHIKDPANLPIRPQAQLRAATELDLAKAAFELSVLLPKLKLPPLAGTLKAETEIRMDGTSDFESAVRMTTAAVRIGQFDVGDAKLEGRLTPRDLTIGRIDLRHSSGSAEVTETRVNFKEPYQFRTNVSVKKLDLQSLFQSIGLQQIPVETTLTGAFPCEGEIDPLSVRCQGRAVANRLVVSSERGARANTIVALNDLGAEGDLQLTTKEVAFQTRVRIGRSNGNIDGAVRFDEGFDIHFKTPAISFADVDNLSNLKFEGTAAIEGQTKGNSQTAKFDLNAKIDDFVFENYTLGLVTGKIAYGKGHLLFQDLHQSIGKTKADGSVDLDLLGGRISGSFLAPSLETSDLFDIYGKIWRFPMDLQASGQGQFDFEGPLDFWKMNYHFNADFGTGRWQGDSFDRLNVKIRGDKGEMLFDQAEMRKNASVLRATGAVHHDQSLEIKVDLTNLHFEDSEMINRIHSNVAGQLNASMTLAGTIRQPEAHIKGSLSDIVVDEQDVAGSFFDLHLNKTQIAGETTLFGNRIQGEFQIPYNPGSPLNLRVKTSDWPFTSLLSVIGASSLQTEFDSNLTSEIDLHSETGRFDRLTGKIAVRDFRIQRGGSSLKNNGPFEINFADGRLTLKNVSLEGPNESYVRLQGEDFRTDHLAVGVQADTDLRLLHLLVPFLEDIGGRIKVETSVAGSLFKPEILGNASLQNAFIKLKGFPHPVEKIQADVVFSQTRLIVQSLKAQMAGGTLDGDGTVQLNGYGNIPVNIRLHGQGLTLNVPDKVKSSGNADLVFSGQWFPFTLSGTYEVSSALVEKEFGDDNNLSAGLRSSNHLPKILREAQFDPVILDISVPLEKNIMIRNSLMDGSVTGQLQVKGPPQSPILLGKITTEKGSKVIFKDKPFELLTGNVTFNNPDEINPELYLSAQSRVEDYDISVVIQGLAKNPTIRMSSVPPLPDQDIISLLALGVAPSRTEQSATKDQASQLGYEALGMGLTKSGTGKVIQKTTGFDVRISSNYDQIKNVSVPKVTFTRKLTERVSAVYSRPISSDDNSQEVQLQYKINSNVSAIASFEDRELTDSTIRDTPTVHGSILGLDLEFKRDFK